MNEVDKYNEYCILVSQLDSKVEELNKVSDLKAKLTYEVGTLKRKLRKHSEGLDMSSEAISSLKLMRMRYCLNRVVSFEGGGGVDGSPITEFKKSSDYKSFTAEQKKLFKKVESSLADSQYSLQNAILIGQDDDESFDVYQSSVIEDYVDELMSNLEDYDSLSVKHLKEIKKIIFIFVEQVSKN